ncbi:MAG: hypothetical protein GX848_00570 [Clostridiales bacterium]|nr:hypothetical protein [Clostridiales bacterium]
MRQIQKSDLRYDFLRNCLSAMFPMVIVIAIFIIGICMPVTTSLIDNRFDYKLLFIGISVGDLVVYPILLIFGMSSAFVQFDFLSSKSKSNVVMSFGISRYRLFLNRIFPSIIAMFIAIFIPLTIILFENGKYIGIESYTIKTYIFFIFSFFTIALLGFTAFTLASLLASTRIESLFLGLSFIALPYVIISFFSLCFKTFLTGYSYRFMPLYKDPLNSLYMLNPLNLARTKIDFWGENIVSSIWEYKGIIRYNLFTENAEYAKKVTSFPLSVYMPFIVWALISVFVLFVAYRVFRNRKIEQNGIHKSSQFVASLISLFMILAGAILSFKTDKVFFFTPDKSYYLTVLIAFTLIISVICLFLFFSKQKRKRALVTLSAFLIVIFSTVFSCTFGGLGFSARIPSLEKIDKIAISLPYKIDTSDIADLDVLSGFETDEEKKLITNIHKMLIEDSGSEASYKDLFIGYYLKNGERVFREYTDISFEVLSEITKIYDSKTAKDYVYSQLAHKSLWSADKNPEYFWADGPSFNLTDKAVLHFDNVDVTLCAVDSNKNTDITEKLTEKRFDTLIHAIAEDTRALNSTDFYTPKEPPIGVISLIDKTVTDNKFQNFPYVMQTHHSFYIYRSMEKTIAYLSFLGVYDVLNEKSEIDEIWLINCENKDYYTQIQTTLIRHQSYDTRLKLRYTSAIDLGIDFTTPYKTITNKDDIAKIREKLHPNYLAITEEIKLAKVTYEDGIAFFVVKD